MSTSSSEFQSILKDALASLQTQFVAGISEFELIRKLQSTPFSLFDQDALGNSLMMFQTHFVLFHGLYQLRNEWRAQNVGELDIGLTRIILQASVNSNANIQTTDPLAEYYLDWKNFSGTDANDVDALLDSFWQKMAGMDMPFILSATELHEACVCLEIDIIDDMSVSELKQQYRKLQHKNHPDKGGTIENSQAILQAYTQLRKYLVATA